MYVNLHGIGYGFALLGTGALFILLFLITLITWLIQKSRSGLPAGRLSGFRWFMANLSALPCAIIILIIPGQSKAFVDWLDHSPALLFFCIGPQLIFLLVWARLLKTLIKA